MVKVTRNDIILMVANKLKQPFTEEDLVLAVWQTDKTRFGLRGFEQQYPNNNLVKCCLMGKDGLIATGEIIKVKTGVYRAKKTD